MKPWSWSCTADCIYVRKQSLLMATSSGKIRQTSNFLQGHSFPFSYVLSIVFVLISFSFSSALSLSQSDLPSTAGLVSKFDTKHDPTAWNKRKDDAGVYFPTELVKPSQGLEKVHTDGYVQKRAVNFSPGWGKRGGGGSVNFSPGWGKRSGGSLNFSPGWGKRAINFSPSWGKRAVNFSPSWGKRSGGSFNFSPGWGKRSANFSPDWGKRSANFSPNWGKRVAVLSQHWDKRSANFSPDWGKRSANFSPDWGKRSNGVTRNERAQNANLSPNYEKRSANFSPDWGKRSDETFFTRRFWAFDPWNKRSLEMYHGIIPYPVDDITVKEGNIQCVCTLLSVC